MDCLGQQIVVWPQAWQAGQVGFSSSPSFLLRLFKGYQACHSDNSSVFAKISTSRAISLASVGVNSPAATAAKIAAISLAAPWAFLSMAWRRIQSDLYAAEEADQGKGEAPSCRLQVRVRWPFALMPPPHHRAAPPPPVSSCCGRRAASRSGFRFGLCESACPVSCLFFQASSPPIACRSNTRPPVVKAPSGPRPHTAWLALRRDSRGRNHRTLGHDMSCGRSDFDRPIWKGGNCCSADVLVKQNMFIFRR
jgi:hypothetical protein